jgi:hypothetical protein
MGWRAIGVAILVALPGALTPPTGARAEPIPYVITFDGVEVVRGRMETNAKAHAAVEAEVAPDLLDRAPGAALLFAPGRGNNPHFVEQGFLVEAFWGVKVGRPEGRFIFGHFHQEDLSNGFEGQHWGHAEELHGVYVRATDGRPFALRSLRYRVTRNRQNPLRPNSIEGFSNFSVNVLVTARFDPRLSVRSQFTAFPVGLPVGNDPTLPFLKLVVFGYERVTQVFIASSASVDLDDIALEAEPTAAELEKALAPPSTGEAGTTTEGATDEKR